MPAEIITLSIDNVDYGGWMVCEVTRSLEAVSGSFSVFLTEKWPGQESVRPIKCGSTCTVLVSGTPVITGFVDEVIIDYTSSSHDVEVRGRDIAGDLVDCSVTANKEWINHKLERIVSELADPFDVKVAVEVPTGPAFVKFRVQEGETVWSSIERACRQRGILCVSDGKGNIVLTRASKDTAVSVIRGGDRATILRASGRYNNTDRFSVYIVKGQRQGFDAPKKDKESKDDDLSVFLEDEGKKAEPKKAAHGKAEAYDREIGRYRPKIIIGEEQGDSGSLKQRAQWECTVARGRSQEVSVTLQGWRDANNRIWEPNRLVRVECDWLRFDNEMLVSTVRFQQDENGTIVDLDLLHPDTFTDAPVALREDLGWGSGGKFRRSAPAHSRPKTSRKKKKNADLEGFVE